MAQSFDAWIGRQESRTDCVTAAPIQRLAAMLDHAAPPWRDGELPPLGHWLFHLPEVRQSELGSDGHPRRGGFMPPIALPRRMWARSRIRFLRSIAIGEQIVRRSTLTGIADKSSGTRQMIVVTVRHDILCGNEAAIEEEQDVVYLSDEASTPRQRAPVEVPTAHIVQPLQPTPQLLFRFSALTFNAHRIHYDRDYARDVEGYPALVVHGPLLATLLVDLFLRQRPAERVTGFSFRAREPTFDMSAFNRCLAMRPGGADLWISGADDEVRLTAQIEAS